MRIKYIGRKPELTLTMPWLQDGPYSFNEENEYVTEVTNEKDSTYLLSMKQSYREVAEKSKGDIAKLVASAMAVTAAQTNSDIYRQTDNEESLTCEICGFAAKTKAGLLGHKRKHEKSGGTEE